MQKSYLLKNLQFSLLVATGLIHLAIPYIAHAQTPTRAVAGSPAAEQDAASQRGANGLHGGRGGFGGSGGRFGPGQYPIYRMPSSEVEENKKAATAADHYLNARILLLRALEEFEDGRKLASPEMFVDSEEWRSAIVARASDLNRVVDPKPRLTRSGVRYKENPALIKRKAERLPRGDDSAKDHNMYGEHEWEIEQEDKRLRGELPDTEKAKIRKKSQAQKIKEKQKKSLAAKKSMKPVSTPVVEDAKAADEKLNDAIEQVLKERLKELEREPAKD